jgi:hypothetical protein
MKTSEKRMKQKYKTQWRPLQQTRTSRRQKSQNLKIKWKLKVKLKNY